ncbi:TIR domain-containing protein [Zobellia sp. B3R18]|uniref:TIR domain-containing protein n=1 Tax=Zobellia sp. B3R18 TaxID=2841568 RepID=UPI001C06BD33|nr:TIR domain-containing protein [Zobellia sp. B3R18]MBU2973049.1 nucleotide-binding protein [Zobellia sp. B3R18]
MTKKHFTIFYSWQSDTDKKENNYLIKKSIEKSIKVLKSDIDLELSLDKDTQKLSGSPNIVDSIFKKIENSDIFICDVTLVNENFFSRIIRQKKTPNPNVLVELGYAIHCLGWERIICVINNSICKIEDLPFDIKQNRISQYSPKSRKGLEDLLKNSIKRIIEDYDDIVHRASSNDKNSIDEENFRQFKSVISGDVLMSSLNFTSSNLRTTGFYYDIWDETIKYLDKPENCFLNDSIRKKGLVFRDALNEFSGLCGLYFVPENHISEDNISNYEAAGIEITKDVIDKVRRSQRYFFPKKPSNDNWDEYHLNHRKVQSELNKSNGLVEKAYNEFILEVKKELLI